MSRVTAECNRHATHKVSFATHNMSLSDTFFVIEKIEPNGSIFSYVT